MESPAAAAGLGCGTAWTALGWGSAGTVAGAGSSLGAGDNGVPRKARAASVNRLSFALVDVEADRLNPRKGTFLFGSLGAAEQLAALRWKIAAVQIPFLIVFFVLIGPRIFVWFAVLLLAVALYNAPRFGCKSHPPFDVLIQASYLLVFVLSIWLNGAAQLPWQTFLFGALFAMHSHIFGEVMDVEPDRLSWRRTTATLIGAVRSKLLIAGFLCVETALVYIFGPGSAASCSM